ncbi:MAG: TolC family protein [Candidatus Azobacteroides sp.]|nr:TolC family protein [Candidatus Azobacteroides sp.]
MNAFRYISGCLIFSMFQSAAAQQSLNLDDCQRKARVNYPMIKQFGLLEKSEEYNLSNLSKAYLPQISLNAQANYQSDAVHFPIHIPGIDLPTIDKDQYRAIIDVTQTIWDGGITSSQQKITRSANEVEIQNVEVTLYSIRERVNNLFFGVLTLDEQIRQLDILKEDLQTNFNTVNALKQNGTSMQSDVDAVQVEILNTEQQKIQLLSLRKAYTEMLSVMINEKIIDQTRLEKPDAGPVNPYGTINRPEVLLFDKQRSLFDAKKSMITAKNRPNFSFFLQGGYGKPGLNMLSNDFEFFGSGGLRFNWIFGNLYTKSNETKLIDVNRNLIDTQEETFLFNTNLQLTQIYNEIQKTKELMKKDDEIIQLRARIKLASESKYKNGVYTVNDLLKDIYAENQSRQAKILHEIQYLSSIYNYKNAQGD